MTQPMTPQGKQIAQDVARRERERARRSQDGSKANAGQGTLPSESTTGGAALRVGHQRIYLLTLTLLIDVTAAALGPPSVYARIWAGAPDYS